jgi:uncharacterized protein (DUF1015 family)
MVELAPFKGIIYNREKIDTLEKVMSPPYDIISEKMQDELYKKHPNNFVRLIFGKQLADDTENDNRYTRAKQLFEEWLHQGVFKQTNDTALYPYKINYMVHNQQKTMSGFFVLLKLDPDYRLVKAHEKTLSKPKADRLNLMRACNANLEPIQLLYIDEKDKIRQTIDSVLSEHIISVKGYDGFSHTLWKIEENDIISTVVNNLNDKVVFIADGHHRYQTAINFAKEKRKTTGNTDPDAPFNYRMVILANMFDEGLAILPTHRLLTLPNLNLEQVITQIEEFFSVEKKPILSTTAEVIGKHIIDDIVTETHHKFALYTKQHYYILTLKDDQIMDKFAAGRSSTWRTLDVSILHKIILEYIMGINETNLEDHVKYTRDTTEAIQFVNDGTCNVSFLMNATKIEELRSIAEAGEHMPQKSTYFLPKMLSGLVMYKM